MHSGVVSTAAGVASPPTAMPADGFPHSIHPPPSPLRSRYALQPGETMHSQFHPPADRNVHETTPSMIHSHLAGDAAGVCSAASPTGLNHLPGLSYELLQNPDFSRVNPIFHHKIAEQEKQYELLHSYTLLMSQQPKQQLKSCYRQIESYDLPASQRQKTVGETVYRLQLGTSKARPHLLNVYADEDIPQGQAIVAYEGYLMTKKEYETWPKIVSTGMAFGEPVGEIIGFKGPRPSTGRTTASAAVASMLPKDGSTSDGGSTCKMERERKRIRRSDDNFGTAEQLKEESKDKEDDANSDKRFKLEQVPCHSETDIAMSSSMSEGSVICESSSTLVAPAGGSTTSAVPTIVSSPVQTITPSPVQTITPSLVQTIASSPVPASRKFIDSGLRLVADPRCYAANVLDAAGTGFEPNCFIALNPDRIEYDNDRKLWVFYAGVKMLVASRDIVRDEELFTTYDSTSASADTYFKAEPSCPECFSKVSTKPGHCLDTWQCMADVCPGRMYDQHYVHVACARLLYTEPPFNRAPKPSAQSFLCRYCYVRKYCLGDDGFSPRTIGTSTSSHGVSACSTIPQHVASPLPVAMWDGHENPFLQTHVIEGQRARTVSQFSFHPNPEQARNSLFGVRLIVRNSPNAMIRVLQLKQHQFPVTAIIEHSSPGAEVSIVRR